MYRCPEHGLNCPTNFLLNNNKKLLSKSNTPTAVAAASTAGRLFGASDVNVNVNRFESLDNIRKMFGLTSNESISHLKGASLLILISVIRKST